MLLLAAYLGGVGLATGGFIWLLESSTGALERQGAGPRPDRWAVAGWWALTALAGVFAVGILLALFRAIPVLWAVHAILRKEASPERRHTLASVRLAPVWRALKGFVAMLAASLLGAYFGLSVAHAREAQSDLRHTVFLAFAIFFAIWMAVWIRLGSHWQNDLGKMEEAARVKAVRDALDSWVDRDEGRVGRWLFAPSPSSREALLDFAETPKTVGTVAVVAVLPLIITTFGEAVVFAFRSFF
ncbi:hypothetical protein Srot_0916 [Segniliparus rotundus DSM 44985]|uniref:Uncharacterized protein n=1 Tax=Segniliparus rotundus (strain ATCC BAA-972 / CDC 1076 / CIP 108378 / DSM 44985 / JCM 13578) TaxID=640132 RepID=D6ZEB2_SEGRD|nr:hypothetical protein [Segniliparus rotundus]ADG97392.1 hypothetical protein Srot_0916 [Segniliparus rotundus DSM 44985]